MAPNAGTPLAIAHRGDPHGHRENTVPAVLAALDQGADLVEIDLALTRDGTAVLLHDETLTRLWGRALAVADTDITEIRAVRSGCGRYEIPEFDQVLRLLAGSGTGLMVDVRAPAAAEAAGEIVEKHGEFDRTVFAGDLGSLLAVRRRWRQARIALSWYVPQRPSPGLLEVLRPEFYNPHWPLLSRPVIDDMHERGLRVSTWTVDHPPTMAQLLGIGVDAVITNRLSRFLAVRAVHQAR
ncbi:glycerophosphodiester phosphodiesterase [Pseudonocardia lutea]|uniref:Glycerophosphodiester phosphodiesterase n=1 Tax=Pseudonocardia lutea TaxID=2172015 RepID=A0ABW1IBG4_9PSEU